jgi:CheY-like chemotaxis protein
MPPRVGRRILFVEDEGSTHFGVREYFAELGDSVDCASDREEALERLATTSYPIVIADLRLSEDGASSRTPEGLEIIERVRRDHPDTRVLVLTACEEHLEAEARRCGADFFLQKPQPLAHVAEIVEKLCRGDTMHEGAETQTRAHPRDPERSDASAAARKKVLLVDDSSTVLFIERALLSRSYEVITASDGREGVQRALADKPDLILMDVMMPQMSGFEAVRTLRAAPETRHIPIIMVSTRGELKSVESGYESGCNDYVTKPFSGVELLAKVKSCLGA